VDFFKVVHDEYNTTVHSAYVVNTENTHNICTLQTQTILHNTCTLQMQMIVH